MPGLSGETINATVWNAVTVQVTTTAGLSSLTPLTAGMIAYLTDTDLFVVYNGSAWLYLNQPGAAPQVLAAPASTVTFTVPAVNRVQVYWRVRATDAVPAESLLMRINGDTTSGNYVSMRNEFNNTSAPTGVPNQSNTGIQVGTVPGASATAGYYGAGNFTIDGVNDASHFSQVAGSGVSFASTSNAWAGTYGGQHLVAAAVTSITLLPANSGAQFAAGCEFSLFVVQ